MAIKISPSILGADFSKLAEEIKRTEQAGADSIHFDIMDNHFVPNLTFGPMLLKSLRPYSDLPFSVHLMVENTDEYLEECAKNGASSITVHSESCVHLHRTLSEIKRLGLKAGVAVNPASSLAFIPYVADLIDEILIMTVNPGFSGQKIIARAINKIGEASKIIRKENPAVEINVDGGINASNARQIIDQGADSIVMASAFYGSNNPKELVEYIKSLR